MISKAYAKINLSLDIIGKQENGYHILKMIMQSIDLYDIVSVEKAVEGISLTCNKSYIPTDDKNIAYRAAKLFIDRYKVESGVKINIVKNIPVAAGMAGGSTDGAAVLKLMRDLFKPKVSNKELEEISVEIGADVPFCIEGGTVLCEGIGEVMTKLQPFKDKILVVVKPNFGVSTKEVYKAFDLDKVAKHPETEELIEAIKKDDLDFICDNMKNLLENVTLNKYPLIKQIKRELMSMGAKGAMMSGSGPTVFAFFDDMLQAQRAYEQLKANYKEIFITRTI